MSNHITKVKVLLKSISTNIIEKFNARTHTYTPLDNSTTSVQSYDIPASELRTSGWKEASFYSVAAQLGVNDLASLALC